MAKDKKGKKNKQAIVALLAGIEEGKFNEGDLPDSLPADIIPQISIAVTESYAPIQAERKKLWKKLENDLPEPIRDELKDRGADKKALKRRLVFKGKPFSVAIHVPEYGRPTLTIRADKKFAKSEQFQALIAELETIGREGIPTTENPIEESDTHANTFRSEARPAPHKAQFSAIEPIEMVRALNAVLSGNNQIKESKYVNSLKKERDKKGKTEKGEKEK